MIKLSASLSKKTPIAGVDYSSQQFGASMEIEVSDTDRPESIQQRMRALYMLLLNTIDEQISGQPLVQVQTPKPPVLPSPVARQEAAFHPQPHATNGHYASRSPQSNGNGHGGSSSQAQQKAIFAICKNIGVDIQDVLADFHVRAAKDLSIRDASTLIDQLKARQSGNGAHA